MNDEAAPSCAWTSCELKPTHLVSGPDVPHEHGVAGLCDEHTAAAFFYYEDSQGWLLESGEEIPLSTPESRQVAILRLLSVVEGNDYLSDFRPATE